MQKHFVYMIYSASHDIFYKGYSSDPWKRLDEHNNNKSRFTANKGPWKLVFTKAFETKTEALIEERRIKRLKRDSLLKLIAAYAEKHLEHPSTL